MEGREIRNDPPFRVVAYTFSGHRNPIMSEETARTEQQLQSQNSSQEEAEERAIEAMVNQIIPVIDGEEYEEEVEPSSNVSEAYLVGGELILEGYCVAFYDHENGQWYSQETLEPVMPDEWWPLPSFGTGMVGDQEEDDTSTVATAS